MQVMGKYGGLPDGVWTLRRLVSHRPGMLVGIVALNLLVALSEGIGLGLLVPVIEQVGASGGPESGVTRTLRQGYQFLGVPFTLETTVLGVALVMSARFLLGFASDWLTVAFQTGYVGKLRASVFEDVVDADIRFHDAHGSDELLDVVLTKVDYADSVIETGTNVLERGLLVLVYLGVALFLAPLLTLALFAGSTLVLLGLRASVEPSGRIGSRIAELDHRTYHIAQEGVQGIRDVKSFGIASDVKREFGSVVDRYVEASVRLARNGAAMDGVYEFLSVMGVLVVIYLSATYTSLTLSGFGVFLFAVYRLVPQLNALNRQLYELSGSLPHLSEAYATVDEIRARTEPTGGTRPPDRIRRIEFDAVSFGYGGEPTLREVSFDLDRERARHVAFVGPSGAGKSTVVSLLVGTYPPDDGEIRLDGTDLRDVDHEAWRARVAVVRQSPYVFNRDLRYNVTLGAPVEQARLDAVCEVAGVTEFLGSLPDGYETELGEHGVRLSGGQRQRVALARALLTDADVLVLDEATSEMDSLLERRVHEGIRSMAADRLTVTIAHRLSTVTDADVIYTMADGRIVEVGPHDELVAGDGTYAELYAAQT